LAGGGWGEGSPEEFGLEGPPAGAGCREEGEVGSGKRPVGRPFLRGTVTMRPLGRLRGATRD
jgi:hypothetical protein